MLADLFTLENLVIFLILTALETVLGFDNLLYITIEAKRVGAKNEARVRRRGERLRSARIGLLSGRGYALGPLIPETLVEHQLTKWQKIWPPAVMTKYILSLLSRS
jgi:hypothetical protein